MSDTTKTLAIDGYNAEGGITELYLTTDGDIRIYAEDAHVGTNFTYSVEQAKAIMAGLGRLIWLAENPNDD